ncbi:MAG: hypothetical protein ACHQHN_11885 [Sphingobacteriales bacterium]
MKKYLFHAILLAYFIQAAKAQTIIPQTNPASGPVNSVGALIALSTGGPATAIQENWGVNICGTNIQPVRIFNASLLVGYQGYSHDFGIGNAYISGNVGIGTTTPAAVLDVATPLPPGNLGTVLARLAEGNSAGGGTYLGVKGYNTQANGNVTYPNIVSFAIEHSFYGVTNSSINFLRGDDVTGGSISFNTNNNSEVMRLLYNGHVLIGKTTQNNAAYLLDVAGGIRSNQVVVNTTGADFVFDPAYRLNSLLNLKRYIDQHHHLPEIPSAKEMRENGLNVGETEIKLLQKIEELTLYAVQNDRKNKDLEARLAAEQAANRSEEARIRKLEEQVQLLLKNK